ncbi:hypothetical protein LZD49_33220 [Dyadobacter sp. CY261]|uniref:hypothetical protein n=1 Tax=Dyadobacter sp. CY261 TaxID=2907203 RepID=UPI001F15B819|nr:hypothetical protein [Dyadobacter sp. CY261]MCF0075387.1 hypothetical protein [Dyadobacter sp. CY261]
MKSENHLRHFCVDMIRMHRSTIILERQRIESQKLNLRQNYINTLKSSKYGPLMKTYLWFSLLRDIYQFEVYEEQRLLRIRNEQEQKLHRLKAAVHAADLDVTY